MKDLPGQDTKPSSTSMQPYSGGGAAGAMKVAVRGADFADGEAALRPVQSKTGGGQGGAAAVQRHASATDMSGKIPDAEVQRVIGSSIPWFSEFVDKDVTIHLKATIGTAGSVLLVENVKSVPNDPYAINNIGICFKELHFPAPLDPDGKPAQCVLDLGFVVPKKQK